MNKKTIIFVLISSFVIGGIGGWVFVRYVTPKLGSSRLLMRYHLAPDNSPLVINTRQEIRYYDGSDTIAAIQTVKPWQVAIISGTGVTDAKVQAGGVVLTSDGLVATTKSAITDPNKVMVKFQDGTTQVGMLKATDPDSDLAFVKVAGKNLATAGLGYPKDLQLGDRIIVLQPSLGEYQAVSTDSDVSSEERNIIYGSVLSTEVAETTFGVTAMSSAIDGSIVFSTDSTIEGMITHGSIISADTIQSALNSYFNGGTIKRSIYGIHYEYIPAAVASAYGSQEGVVVKAPDPKTPALTVAGPGASAGLLPGDIITKVAGTQINFDNSFEDLLDKNTNNQPITFTVERGTTQLQITITPTTTK